MLPTCFPSIPHPHSPTKPGAAIRIGSRRVAHRPGDSVEELSGGTGDSVVALSGGTGDSVVELSGGTGDSVVALSGTEAVRWGPDHRASPTLMGTCNNYSNRIQSFARCLQHQQPSSPTPRNAPLGHWCSITIDGS